jgi:hypothetical protein
MADEEALPLSNDLLKLGGGQMARLSITEGRGARKYPLSPFFIFSSLSVSLVNQQSPSGLKMKKVVAFPRETCKGPWARLG